MCLCVCVARVLSISQTLLFICTRETRYEEPGLLFRVSLRIVTYEWFYAWFDAHKVQCRNSVELYTNLNTNTEINTHACVSTRTSKLSHTYIHVHTPQTQSAKAYRIWWIRIGIRDFLYSLVDRRICVHGDMCYIRVQYSILLCVYTLPAQIHSIEHVNAISRYPS